MRHPKSTFIIRNRYFFVLDILVLILAGILSFLVRLDFNLAAHEWQGLLVFLSFALPIQLLTFLICGMYVRYWHNAGAGDLLFAKMACAIASLLTIVATFGVGMILPNAAGGIPRSVPFIDGLLVTLCVVTLRFSQRAYRQQSRTRKHSRQGIGSSRVLIIGAGETGIQVLDSIERSPDQTTIIGFLDDDPNKIGQFVHGKLVVGRIDYLKHAVQRYDVSLVIIAMPSATGILIRQIVATCQELGVDHKTIPGLAELVNGHVALSKLRPVSIDDLLRRAPVQLNVADMQRQVEGCCVMITGAGGSIGSELVRQVAYYKPSALLLVGHGENSLFEVENRLKHEYPDVKYHVLLADVRDLQRLNSIFSAWRPKVVFHAAAYKHVPMLETNIIEAVVNNVVGTNNLIELCNRHEVERMVMISTDKAVDPTSIMGMTKRVAEILMMHAACKHPHRFAVVRFGNVLGSRGSVVLTFQQQIAAGGPVTVTSKEITRFFMSIPEAVRLVLKASLLTEHGPLFVLNMGEQIRVLDLAHDLIRLSGLEPGRDIEVKITKLRLGEKLHEELFWNYEDHQSIEQGALYSVQLSGEVRRMIGYLPQQIQQLIQAARDYNADKVFQLLTTIVCTSPMEVSEESPIRDRIGTVPSTSLER